MPPPPPDRKEFLYKENRRHDGGGDALAAAAPTPPRWRDPPYHQPPPPPLRDNSRPSPRRTSSSVSSGYYRQGGGAGAYERPYPDEQHGYTPSRSDRHWPDDDGGGGYRSFGRYGGGGRRDGRDGRGPYRRSPFRSYGSEFSRCYQEPPPLPPPGRSPLRSVAVPISYQSSGDRADKVDRDHMPRVTPWQPLRRRDSKSEAADAVGAGFATKAPFSETEELAQSLDAVAPQMAEEETPRKKARLGWGQGLAKYEKQKVQGSAEVTVPAPVEGVMEASLPDAQQKASEPSPVGCASPPVAVPSPAPQCSYSPVAEDKSCERAANTVVEPGKDVSGPDVQVQSCENEVPIRLDQLDGDPVGALAAVLADLLQHEDAYSGDSTFTRHTDVSKLSLLKENISKELEKTELEIDSLEGELKSVNIDAGDKTQKDSPMAVSYVQNPSPINGTSEICANNENCEMISSVKEPGELVPSPKIFMEQDAGDIGAKIVGIDASVVDNVKTASLEERDGCLGIAETQLSAIVDCSSLKAFDGNGLQHYASQDTLEAISGHVNVNSIEENGGGNFSIRQCSYGDANSNLITIITDVNKDVAKRTFESVVKPLPTDRIHFDLCASSHVSDQRKNDLRIKEKLSARKNRVSFKEQLLTFKFKVLHHLWKEDVQLLSARKHRSKSSKRDSSNRASQSNSQKQCSSSRSRLTMPGNLSILRSTEISDVASKLHSKPQIKHCRSYLKMPSLIIDEKEKRDTRFVSKNGLIEDPVSVEKEKAMINPWTDEEKGIFMEMLATFGKDFSKISSFLEHKTTADCIEFYYKHHKSDSFREVRKLLDLRKQRQPTSNYLGTKSLSKWNPEANSASLDMLGVASVVAAHDLGGKKRVEKNSSKSIIRTTHVSDIPYVTKMSSDMDCVTKPPLREKESVAADVLAGLCGTLSPEAIGSCITSSVDPLQKINFADMEHPLTPEVDQSFDEEDTCSDQGGEAGPVDWNDDEKAVFLEAVNNYGKDFARISSCVKSKSYEQCRVFFSKARKSLGLDSIHQGIGDVGMPMSDNNGGRSDTDEACAAEMDSAICSTQSCSKMEVDGCQTAADEPVQEFVLSGSTSKQPEDDRSNMHNVLDGMQVEEGESKADKNCNILGDDKQSNGVTNEGASGPMDINCIGSTRNLETAEDDGTQANVHECSTILSSTEHAAVTCSEIRSTVHSVEAIQPSSAVAEISVDGSRKESCSHHMPESTSRKEGSSHHVPESTSAKTENSAVSLCSAADGVTKENSISLSNMAGISSSRPSFTPSFQHKVQVDLLHSKPKPQVTPLTPKDLMPVQFSSLVPDPTLSCFKSIASVTTSNFEDHGNKFSKSSGTKDLNQYPVFKDSSTNQHDPLFHNMNGYTLHRRNSRAIEGESDRLVTEVPHFSESNASCKVGIPQADQFVLANVQNGRSSSSSLASPTTVVPWTRNGEDRHEGLLRPCYQSANPESEEQLKRPGDVKLFGQILSHQSSLQSSGSSSDAHKNKPPSPKIDRSATSSLNNSKRHVVCSSRPTTTGHLGLEGRAARSYAPGSRTQPSISSLPDPVVMMAKCQRPLAGGPFYSANNGTLGVLTEYQQPLMQQFPSDMKRLDGFADLQKRSGIELISGFQHSGKGAALGTAGVLVSGVTDPVAAVKVQYAPGANIVSNNMDPWRDIGGR